MPYNQAHTAACLPSMCHTQMCFHAFLLRAGPHWPSFLSSQAACWTSPSWSWHHQYWVRVGLVYFFSCTWLIPWGESLRIHPCSLRFLPSVHLANCKIIDVIYDIYLILTRQNQEMTKFCGDISSLGSRSLCRGSGKGVKRKTDLPSGLRIPFQNPFPQFLHSSIAPLIS